MKTGRMVGCLRMSTVENSSIMRWVFRTYHQVAPILAAEPGTHAAPGRRMLRSSRNNCRTTAQITNHASAPCTSPDRLAYSVHMLSITDRSNPAKEKDLWSKMPVIFAPAGGLCSSPRITSVYVSRWVSRPSTIRGLTPVAIPSELSNQSEYRYIGN